VGVGEYCGGVGPGLGWGGVGNNRIPRTLGYSWLRKGVFSFVNKINLRKIVGPSEIKMYVYVMLLYVKKQLCISCTKKLNKKFSQSINLSLCLNEFGGTCLGSRMHTQTLVVPDRRIGHVNVVIVYRNK
jgi:hypothetical protein